MEEGSAKVVDVVHGGVPWQLVDSDDALVWLTDEAAIDEEAIFCDG